MSGNERSALESLRRRPANLAVLIERLGLSGDTDDTVALCESLDGLMAANLIERDPSPGFMSVRWRITMAGQIALGS